MQRGAQLLSLHRMAVIIILITGSKFIFTTIIMKLLFKSIDFFLMAGLLRRTTSKIRSPIILIRHCYVTKEKL